MSKDIWHRYDEAPKHQDIIMTDTGCWAYRADLLALETELERTRKALYLAFEMLKDIKNDPDTNDELTQEIADRLDEIKTTLEQKESAFVHNKIEFPEYNDGLLEEFDKQFFENGQDDDLTETALEQKDK